MPRIDKSIGVSKFISNLELYFIYRKLFQDGKFEKNSRPLDRMNVIHERLGNPAKKWAKWKKRI